MDVRLKVQHDLRNLARTGFLDGRDKAPKTTSRGLELRAKQAVSYWRKIGYRVDNLRCSLLADMTFRPPDAYFKGKTDVANRERHDRF